MKNVSFLAELLEKDSITEHVRSISLKDDPSKVYLSTTDKLGPSRENVLYTDVPGYLNISFAQNGQKKWEKSVATFEGSYIDLKKYNDLDHLLKSKLSSKRVSRLRAYKRTLEKVFPIDYQYYYGEIQDRIYEKLMNTLKRMVTTRFDEKQMNHMALTEWDRFKELGKGLIREKKASLIVIYHGDEPIHISFNYIWKQLVFGYVRGFNIDYSKFYLGYIDIMIQLQWCFEMGFEIYDLLRENMEYKLRFADHTYLYACHIVVAKQVPFSIISPLITWLLLSLKFDIYYPFMSRLRAIYHRIPFLPKRKKRRIQLFYHLEKLDKEQWAKMDKERFSQTGINSLNETYGKRAVYHFLYLSKEKLEHLKIYTSLEDEHSIILECPNSLGKVIFKNRVEKHGK
ncbi:GNAT family N-acetyltransferase [Muricauda brasiliensis]|uniref:GNAT family N-acetyltransferase n=1 Tax=Muricauda brasiliensis TaxID=2162892 RepID=UPI000D3AD245|nr:GNAT family N-acetyltransferase [Muricauda brasiliensis]